MCLTKSPEQTSVIFFLKISAEDRQQLSKMIWYLNLRFSDETIFENRLRILSEFASPSYQQQQQQTYTEANAFVLSKMRQPRDKKNSDLVILRY